MESKNKKLVNSDDIDTTRCRDRLSEMPDEVIVHILSFLPTLDAVRTMLLRRLGNLWTLVPVLKFDLEDYTDGMIRLDTYDDLWTIKPLLSSELDEYYDTISSAQGPIFWVFPRFSEFVRKVLTLHKSPTIDTFHILIDKFEDDLYIQDVIDDVQMWLTFAIDKGVKDLKFEFSTYQDTLPSCVFTCQSLVTLSLSEFKLEDQPRVQLPSLRKLSLVGVHGSDQAFQQLISGCPSLQEVTVDNAVGLKILNVINPSVCKLFLRVEDDPISLNSPALKVLDIDIACSYSSWSYQLEVIDASSLQEVNVSMLPRQSDKVVALFSQFRSVEAFTLLDHAFSGLSSIKTNFPQNRWKRLVLHPCWDTRRCLLIIFGLVTASVKLEDLEINVGNSLAYGDKTLDCPKISTSVMPLLKTVTIHCNGKCLGGQLKLVELLLRNAIVLEKLVITFKQAQLTIVEEYNFVQRVLRFKKASTNATVVFA